MNPKVFISHAREDKQRFVLSFATKLYEKGIEAWVDEWEMLPGDSLVDRIWDEGIGQAQAIVVVLSEYSINKPWVKAELNTGVIRRIEGHSRLIPIVIGDVADSQIPESLHDTLWERIGDLNDYGTQLDRIVKSIYGQVEKPPLGKPPAYTQAEIDAIPGLTDVDNLVLKLCCEAQLQQEGMGVIFSPTTIFERAAKMDLAEEEVLETLEVLGNRGYLDLRSTGEGTLWAVGASDYGFEEYARTYVPGYDSVFRSIALQLANHERNNSLDITEALEQPATIVEHVLNQLASRGYIKSQTLGEGVIFVSETSPELKRWLRET